MKSKCFIIFTITILLSIFISIFVIQNSEYASFQIKLLSLTKEDVVLLRLESREWIVNSNIVQYSSYFIKDDENKVQVVAFVLLDKELENLLRLQRGHESNINCIIRNCENKVIIIKNEKVVKINLMPIEGFPKSLWRIHCDLDNEIINVGVDYQVAIVDRRKYDRILGNSIQYHIPKNRIRDVPRKNAVAHCVHMLRNIEEEKMEKLLNWLDIQKKIGVAEISLYVYNVSNEALNSVVGKHGDGEFVKIIHYKTRIEDVCRYNGNETVYALCNSSYNYHFDMNEGSIMNSHERINTNDCFFNYKYEYKYVTTYDIDEIILPRKFDTSFINITCHDSDALSNLGYSVYDYYDTLFEKYGEKVSNLEFENVVYFKPDDDFMRFLNKLNESKEGDFVALTHKSKNVTFKIVTTENLREKIDLMLCLQKKLKHKRGRPLNEIWYRGFASLMNMRSGKSVFSTQYTEGINQHFTDEIGKPISKLIELNEGYCSHFADETSRFFIEQKYPINFYLADIEQFLFLINSFSN